MLILIAYLSISLTLKVNTEKQKLVGRYLPAPNFTSWHLLTPMIQFLLALYLVAFIAAQRPFDPLSHPNWHVLDTGAVCGRSTVREPRIDNNPAVRILRGEDAIENEFPWMAQLMKNDTCEPICGGSLINKRYVLTAAHCVCWSNTSKQIPKDILRVRLGAHRLLNNCNGENSCKQFEVKKIIKHGNYYPHVVNNELEYMKFDIALIVLKEDVQFREGVISPICLPANGKMISRNWSGQRMIVAGFGQNVLPGDSRPTPYPEVLQKLSTTVVHPRKCNVTRWDDSKQICARSFGPALGPGDSGGPLMYSENNVYYQVGIVSYGRQVTNETVARSQHTVYTSVPSYMKWILKHVSPW